MAVVTAKWQLGGGRQLALKAFVGEASAMGGCENIKSVVISQRTKGNINIVAGRDRWLHDLMEGQPSECEPTWVGAEHPRVNLYTAGSTGKPKGRQHAWGGYLLWALLTMKWAFDYQHHDADP